MRILPLLSISFMLAACSNLQGSKQIETEFGKSTYFVSGPQKSIGNNQPTIIFESGLSDDMITWQPVLEQVSKFAQVFAYNRAGFEGSESDQANRSGRVIIEELRALLQTLKLKPPFVLVGHSLGGGYMELFAKSYPAEVLGVVLIDPNSAKFTELCQRYKLENCQPPNNMPWWASLFYPMAVEAELKGMSATHKQINNIDRFPKVPLAVLSATKKVVPASTVDKDHNWLYHQLHKELAQLSPTSLFQVCESCSHYIHQDKPDLVIEAIKWVLAHNPP